MPQQYLAYDIAHGDYIGLHVVLSVWFLCCLLASVGESMFCPFSKETLCAVPTLLLD